MDLEWVRRTIESAVGRHCPRWLVAHREDLVQTAMARILDRARPGGGDAEMNATYLWKTAHSVVLDELRRKRWEAERPLGSERPAETQARGADPEREAAAREIGRHVTDCLKTLVQPRRRAVTLHLVGYAPAEAGALLAWSAKRVSNLVHRGLADLRECLGAKGVGP
jgi:RNA polymerase sigma factor (sigma-70 family)